ncbi:MAG: ZIP family metal transporter, partial [Phycisphaerales bacterium]|nr:ZIP family metal transporter [Phycisphaerales bacterium]
AVFFHLSERWLQGHEEFDLAGLRRKGGLAALLIVAAMTVHSLPEGVAVGVAFGSGDSSDMTFGWAICIAIAVHNVPEGLAIALALRSQGIGPMTCVGWAIFTSLPQPIAAVPAAWLVWIFEPLLGAGMGFAAGAMFVLVVRHLIPDARRDAGSRWTSGGIVGGAAMMLALMQATAWIAGTIG